ncbi:hypothetical protein [Falsiroseomonas ponticola]|jgi:hypothetical protein|uniref:hypothetical protein n=1 Tax=Falsiroseomonas ponticola TaxID=2786951 RepID=UPI0019333475|nr:hypothetical protein [Roseomonas ponticola]
MRVLLKLSPQNQITLRKDLRAALGPCSHVEVEPVKGGLMLRPAIGLTMEEARAAYGKHGFTEEVLAEALRIVQRRGPGSAA